MIKKTITYSDLDGKEFTEDFYFNLSQAEFLELEMIHENDGGFREYLTSVTNSGNGKAIMELFKEIISMAYGTRSEDGKSFVKRKGDQENFMGSEAYEKLFIELLMGPDTAAEFVNGLLPAKVQAAAAEVRAQDGFRPGASTLPTSRREQLEAERAAAQAPSTPVQTGPDVAQAAPPVVQTIAQPLETSDQQTYNPDFDGLQ
jgi:hypothetical protein